MRTSHRGHRKPFPQPRRRMVAAAVAAACSCRRRESVVRHVEESPGLHHRTIGSSAADPLLYHNHHTSTVASALGSQSRGCGFKSHAPQFCHVFLFFCTHAHLGPIPLRAYACFFPAFGFSYFPVHAYFRKCHHFELCIAKYPCIQIKQTIYVKCLEFYLVSQFSAFIHDKNV